MVLAGAGVIVGAGGVGGCASPDKAVGFDEPDPHARLRAVQRAAASGDRSSIPALINLLSSDDAAERMLAIRSLESMTGQTLGYDHAAPPEARREAAGRWAAWYAQQQKPGGGTGRGVGGGEGPHAEGPAGR
jgi:hypothetical protein